MNFSKKIIISAIILNLAVPCCFAINDTSSSRTITLKECIEKAINNSPNIKRAKINYEMAKKNVKIAQSVYFPTLSAGVGYDFSTRSGSNINSATGNTFNANAGIKQLIWNFGKSSASIKMQKFNKIVAAYDFDTMVLDTIFDVKVKYYSALASKAAIEIDKSNLQINERNYQRTNAYFTEGLKSKIDLVNAEVYAVIQRVEPRENGIEYIISNIINLTNTTVIAVAPTQARHGQTIRVSGLPSADAVIRVYNLYGTMVKNIKTNGDQIVTFEAEDSDGIYIVNVKAGEYSKSVKYIVK